MSCMTYSQMPFSPLTSHSQVPFSSLLEALPPDTAEEGRPRHQPLQLHPLLAATAELLPEVQAKFGGHMFGRGTCVKGTCLSLTSTLLSTCLLMSHSSCTPTSRHLDYYVITM